MPTAPSSRPSFSPGRKWSIGFSVAVMTVAAFAVVVMLNYLSGQIFRRAYLSSNTRVELSTRTTSLLHSLTNRVLVTVYCSKDEPFFADMADLLKEYTSASPNLSVRYIDYDRDPGAAEQFKIKYSLVGSTNKNLILFDCEGRIKTVNGDALVQNQLSIEPSDNPEERGKVRKKPINFLGELLFTGALVGVTNPKPLKAYFLEGHGEHGPDNASDQGYAKFADVLKLNCVTVEKLTLLGTNTVPDDCNLLVIAGPKDPLQAVELSRIEKYLNEGGRLLALFNFIPVQQNTITGLEKLLAKWGVNVTTGLVKDPDFFSPPDGLDVIAFTFRVRHPIVNSLLGSRLQLILPREIDALDLSSQPDNALKAEEIVYSGPRSFLSNGGMLQGPAGKKPLIVAVEKTAAKGVAAERGATRLLVTGDSLFLTNKQIESAANRDFAGYAANWLLDRPVLLEGVAPKSINEYRLSISNIELQTVRWILLAAMPGGVLLLGGLVWLRRRK